MSSIHEDGQTGNFTIGQQLFMFLYVEASLLSGLAVTVLLLYKLTLLVRRRRSANDDEGAEADAADSSLFLSLMVGEVLRSIGGGFSIRWILEGVISQGKLCQAQGYTKLIGTNIIDFSTGAITIHTFTVLILRWKPPKHIVKYLTAAVWVIVVLIELITFAVHPKDLMGPTGYWCWIPRTHTVAQVMAEYFWMWLIGLITLVLYTVGYFVLKRNPATTHEAEEMRSIARQLLWKVPFNQYPLVYLVCILPQSIARWLMFTNNPVPYEFTLLARSLFSLSGLFNVILFFTTRYDLVAGVSGAPQPQSAAGTAPTQAPNGAAGGNYYSEKANGTLDSRSYSSSPLSPYATHDPLLSNLKPNYKQHGRLPHSPLSRNSYGQRESPSHNRQEINFGPHGIYSDAQHQPHEMGDRDLGSVIQVNEASLSKDPSSSTQRTPESDHDEDSDEMGRPPPAIRG